MQTARDQHSAKLKFRAVLDLLVKGEQSLGDVAHQYHVHPVTLRLWKDRFLELGARMFEHEFPDPGHLHETALSSLLRRQAD